MTTETKRSEAGHTPGPKDCASPACTEEREMLARSESAAVARQIAADAEALSWRQRCEHAEAEARRISNEAFSDGLCVTVLRHTIPLLRDVANDIGKSGFPGLARDINEHREGLYRLANRAKIVRLPLPAPKASTMRATLDQTAGSLAEIEVALADVALNLREGRPMIASRQIHHIREAVASLLVNVKEG